MMQWVMCMVNSIGSRVKKHRWFWFRQLSEDYAMECSHLVHTFLDSKWEHKPELEDPHWVIQLALLTDLSSLI